MNPYGNDMIVDQVIGSAYQVVRYVAANMETLIELSDSMDTVKSVLGGLQSVIDNMPALLEISGNIPDLLELHSHLSELLVICDNLSMLSNIHDSLDDIQIIADNLDILSSNVALLNGNREALRRSYAEAGYNLVNGSFEVGGTLVNANDVLLHEASGKAFSGPTGTVAARTTPVGGVFVDKSGELLRSELATSNGATKVGTSDGRTVEQRLAALPNEVDAAGTAASLIYQHNNDYFAHTQLTEQIAEEVHRAELAADEAEAARDAAIATAGPLYATIAEGRAAVANGQTFAVQGSGGIAANVYRRIDASRETLIASLPSADLVYTTFDPNVNLVWNGDFRHGLAGYLATHFDDIYKFYPDGAGHILIRPEFISTAEAWDILPSFVVPSNADSRMYVKPGEVYTCSLEFDVVSTSASDTDTIAVLSVRCHDEDGVQLAKSDFNVNKLNCSGFDNGKRNYTTITAPANASYIKIIIYCVKAHTFSRYGLGKVKLERGAAMTPFVASRDSFTDTSNLSYDPLSITYPPKLTNAVLETDSYGESVVVGTQLNTVADVVNLYETNRIAVKKGDILTLAFELDASGTTGSLLAAQLRGFSLTDSTLVWEKRRYLPVADFPQWELKDHTRTWTCVSGLIPAGIDYIVGRLITIPNSNYSKVRARRFSVKRGMNNYTFSQYNKDPLTKAVLNVPSSMPSDFEFWPKGWRDLGNAEYDQDNWENVRDGFSGSYLSLKQSCVESALPFSIVSERYAVTPGENITYSLKLAGQLNAGKVTVQLAFFDENGKPGSYYGSAYPASAFSQSYFTINKTHVVPSGMATAAIRVVRDATALGTSLYVKDPLLIKGVALPTSYQPQGDIRTISDKFTEVNGELVSIKDDIEELKDAAGSLAYGVVGWAIDSHGSYYTGEATNEFVQKPTTIPASPAVTPVVVPVTAATALPGMRMMIMAPGIAKTGTRLWSVFSTSLTSTGEGADDFNIIQYSDDDGVTWKEAFYWKCSTLDYRLNTPHVYLESDGGLTFFTGYDVTPIGSDTTLGAWAFTIKNPQKTSGVFNITRQWRVLPTGYPNCIFESDGRKLLIGGTPTPSKLTDYKGINFYKYDHKNRWLNREANYLPSYAFWPETQVVQLANGSHMLMYRDDSAKKLKVAYSHDGLDQFGAASDPAFLTATTAARFALRVSPSGRLYIVYNASTNRKMLTLALLNETGTSVVSSILVEPRQTENASYPDLKFDGDNMYIAWDFIRTTGGGKSPEIVLGKLSEADFIANGSSAVITRTIIATKNPNHYV